MTRRGAIVALASVLAACNRARGGRPPVSTARRAMAVVPVLEL
jgi:hypothetical protein